MKTLLFVAAAIMAACCVADAWSSSSRIAAFVPVKSSSSSSSSAESSETDEPTTPRRQISLDEVLNTKVSKQAEMLSGQELVDFVNENQNLWKAELNEKFSSLNDNVKWGLMGVKNPRTSDNSRKNLAKSRFLDISLPKEFDARTQWPNCPSIRNIRDQSSCGSCWAFGAVEAISDRICIASRGNLQPTLSADDLLSCCKSCGFGCDGGDPLSAWKFWVTDGIVTGSNFTQKSGCRPYPFPPCEHHSTKTHFQPCKHDLYPTPTCDKQCQSTYSKKSYAEDKYYGRTAYAIMKDEKAILNELYTNGPLEVAFDVYEDFLNYKSGIYSHKGGRFGGGHAVKLIGWGEENNVPYWIVANSWNTDWGEDGFFRILRGKNECGIESYAVGGLPDLKRTYSDLEDTETDETTRRSARDLSRHRYHADGLADEDSLPF